MNQELQDLISIMSDILNTSFDVGTEEYNQQQVKLIVAIEKYKNSEHDDQNTAEKQKVIGDFKNKLEQSSEEPKALFLKYLLYKFGIIFEENDEIAKERLNQAADFQYLPAERQKLLTTNEWWRDNEICQKLIDMAKERKDLIAQRIVVKISCSPFFDSISKIFVDSQASFIQYYADNAADIVILLDLAVYHLVKQIFDEAYKLILKAIKKDDGTFKTRKDLDSQGFDNSFSDIDLPNILCRLADGYSEGTVSLPLYTLASEYDGQLKFYALANMALIKRDFDQATANIDNMQSQIKNITDGREVEQLKKLHSDITFDFFLLKYLEGGENKPYAFVKSADGVIDKALKKYYARCSITNRDDWWCGKKTVSTSGSGAQNTYPGFFATQGAALQQTQQIEVLGIHAKGNGDEFSGLNELLSTYEKTLETIIVYPGVNLNKLLCAIDSDYYGKLIGVNSVIQKALDEELKEYGMGTKNAMSLT